MSKVHCSSCGNAIDTSVIYCTRCGAKATATTESGRLPESSFNILIAGILGIPIAGVGVAIGLLSVMKEVGFTKFWIIAFVSLCFLLLLAAETVFIWLLVQNRARKDTATSIEPQLEGAATKQLGEAKEVAQPLGSVTEGATRPFEPVPRKDIRR